MMRTLGEASGLLIVLHFQREKDERMCERGGETILCGLHINCFPRKFPSSDED